MRGAGLALALWASLAGAQPAEPRFEDSIEQRMQACVACHGVRGRGIADSAFPRLAGQPAAYLASQMRAFRDGRRTYAPMNFLMSRQSDAYLSEIADYFARQSPDPAVVRARRSRPTDAAAFEAGRVLVLEGRGGAEFPACVACHGATLAGRLPAIPALAGLPRDFLIEQVGSWKSGAHRSAEPDCMARIARQMTGADIVAAATWLALQEPVGVPDPNEGLLPLACGSP